MTAIVYQTDKRSGITYAYKSISFWDKDKQQSRAKRTLIGRLDSESGQIHRWKMTKKKQELTATKRGSLPSLQTSRSFYGATYLLDVIGEKAWHYR